MTDRRDDETEIMPAATAPDSGWRLVDLQSGRSHEIPSQGMVIGRDEQCDLVLSARGVSRRHAVIRRSGAGYTITDESKNGTFVNDARVQRVQTLARGDVVRIATEEFRVDSSGRISSSTSGATEVLATIPEPGRGATPAAPRVVRSAAHRETPSPALATLEVMRGPLAGTRFNVTRPVCSIGRAANNDIVMDEDSVSGAHATLLLKAGAWFVLDLRSSNGTFVDGYRVAGERVLPDGATLSVGDVRLVFRQGLRIDEAPRRSRRHLGFFARLAKLIGNG